MSIRLFGRTLLASTAALYTYASTFDIYDGPLGRAILSMNPETSHRLALTLIKYRLAAPTLPFSSVPPDPPRLKTTAWGISFPNPIGLAAGFDKHAQAVRGLFSLGFGFVELGSVTPLPQPGNPTPRVFRLVADQALINRYGCNSHGAQLVRTRLERLHVGAVVPGPFGLNLAKNRDTPQHLAVYDYVSALRELGDLADYVVVNVSSPNTPALRDLQAAKALEALLVPLLAARDQLMYRPPILVKLAPDLSHDELKDVCQLALRLQVDGLILSNTTTSRKQIQSPLAKEAGGLSGRPLKHRSTKMIRDAFSITEGRIPIIGVGGVENGQDAYDKIRAGATLVQLYTALVYRGPRLVCRIKAELDQLLERDGFDSVIDAVGVDHRETASKP